MKKGTISFFNAFVPHAPFLFAPKNIYFQGVEKDCIGKGLIKQLMDKLLISAAME